MRAARMRRLGSAACLVLGPGLILAAGAVQPYHGDADTEEIIQIAGENVARTQVGSLLAFLGILAMIPAVLAVMRALRSRAPALGLVGGCLAVCGWAAAVLWPVSDQFNVAVSSEPGIIDRFAAATEDSSVWVLFVVLAVFLVGVFVGTLVLGIGMLRARVVPAWAAAAVIAGPVVTVAAGAAGVQALDLLGTALLLVGFAAGARLVASVGDREWDRGEIAPPGREERRPATA